MADLPPEAEAVLTSWVSGNQPNQYAEDYLEQLVDALKNTVKPVPSGKRGRPASHPLLPLLIWAVVSRYQIINRLPAYSTALTRLAGESMPNGRVYEKRDLERIYPKSADVLSSLNRWIWLEHEVSAAIKAADMFDTDKTPHELRMNGAVKKAAQRYRKKLGAELDAMTSKEFADWREEVTLNGIYHQLRLFQVGKRSELIVGKLLIQLANIRSIPLSTMKTKDQREWINSVYVEIGYELV